MYLRHAIAGLAKPPSAPESGFTAYNSPIGDVAPTLIVDFNNEVYAADTGSGLANVARDTLITGFTSYTTEAGKQVMTHTTSDAVYVAVSGFNYSTSEGSIQVIMSSSSPSDDNDRVFQFDHEPGGDNDRLTIYSDIISDGDFRFLDQSNSLNNAANITITGGNDPYSLPTGLVAFGCSWNDTITTGGLSVSLDSSTVQTAANTSGVTAGSTNTITRLWLMGDGGSGNKTTGNMQKLIYWNTKLSDADVGALSSTAEGP
jgi:hypothetical protein